MFAQFYDNDIQRYYKFFIQILQHKVTEKELKQQIENFYTKIQSKV